MRNSPTEVIPIEAPAYANGTDESCLFVYNGVSMLPTFKPGQVLVVQPVVNKLVPGDVVVYADMHSYSVHRVIGVTPQGLITRGDNNRLVDALPVTPEQIVGRVEAVHNQPHSRRVRGGVGGLIAAQIGWGVRAGQRMLRRILHKPYISVRQIPLVRRVLLRLFAPYLRRIRIQTESGVVIKTTFRGRTVARYLPDHQYFECRKPFDLFLDPPR